MIRLFAYGRRHGGVEDVVLEEAGVRVNWSHAARVKAAKRAAAVADEQRANFRAVPVDPARRDAANDGSLDFLEGGRV